MGGATFLTEIGSVAWIALVPFAWCLTSNMRVLAFVGAPIVIVAWHILGLDFIRLAYRGEAANAWVVLSILAAIPFVVGLALARYAFRGRDWPMAIELPLVWVTMEYARMYFVAIFTEVSFPYLQIGSLVDAPRLLQVADLSGPWTLSFLVAAVNGVIYDAVSIRWPRRANAEIPRRAKMGILVGVVLLVGAAVGLQCARFGSAAAALAYVRGQLFAVVPSTFDIGEGARGERREIQLTLVNLIDRPIKLLGARSTCGCLAAPESIVDKTIPAGEKIALPIEIAFKGEGPTFVHEITFYSEPNSEVGV